jgi:hypothetical protein
MKGGMAVMESLELKSMMELIPIRLFIKTHK